MQTKDERTVHVVMRGSFDSPTRISKQMFVKNDFLIFETFDA